MRNWRVFDTGALFVLFGVALPAVLSAGCSSDPESSPGESAPRDETGTTTQALVSDPLLKVQNRRIKDLGGIPLGPPGTWVTARDGTDCVELDGRRLFMFGDTVSKNPSTGQIGFITNSLLWTTDTNFTDGIDPSLSGNLTVNGAQAAFPQEFIPRDANNIPDMSSTMANLGAHIFLWPGQFIKNGAETFATYTKYIHFSGEACSGDKDEDRDGSVDCADSDCANVRPCKTTGEICDNTAQLDADPELEPVDDDGDGKGNCADSDCAGVAGCSDGHMVGVGVGLTRVISHDQPSQRFSDFRSNLPNDSATGVPEHRMLFAPDMPGWSHLRQDPELSDFEVVDEVVNGVTVKYLYLFDAYAPPNTDGTPADDPTFVYLARAPLGDTTADTDAIPDFMQFNQWKAYKAGTNGAATWVDMVNKGPVLQTTRVQGVQKHMSVKWSAFYRAYLMTYIDGQNQMIMRVSSKVTGPWVDPTYIQAPEGSAYVGRTQACLDTEQGRTEYVTYALQGEVTGSGIRLKQLRFSGRGDYADRGTTDIALLGGSGATNLPVAISNGSGNFTLATRTLDATFRTDATPAAVKKLPGDFNGDGRGDLLLTGGTLTTLKVATSQDSGGTFVVSSPNPGSFASLAGSGGPGVLAVPGDFDGNGTDDVILLAGPTWTGVPMALSSSNGTWSFKNEAGVGMHWLASVTGVRVFPGDFDRDGDDDIAFVGGNGWTSVAFAFSNRDGSFNLVSRDAPSFSPLANNSANKPVAGDFNADGQTDLAVVLTTGDTLAVAYVKGNSGPLEEVTVALRTGAFLQTPVTGFNAYAAKANVRAVAGDFNGDNFGDIALVGAASDNNMPIAFGLGGGVYAALINTIPAGFATEIARTGVKSLSVY